MNQQPHPKKKLKQVNKWLKFSNLGIQMAACIAIGVFSGIWLDKKFPDLEPLFTVVLSLFGVFASLYLVYKQAIQMSKEEDN